MTAVFMNFKKQSKKIIFYVVVNIVALSVAQRRKNFFKEIDASVTISKR